MVLEPLHLIGGAHDDVALVMVEPMLEMVTLFLHVLVDACGWTPCLMMVWSHDAYLVMVVA